MKIQNNLRIRRNKVFDTQYRSLPVEQTDVLEYYNTSLGEWLSIPIEVNPIYLTMDTKPEETKGPTEATK